jgi:hypothetical protein
MFLTHTVAQLEREQRRQHPWLWLLTQAPLLVVALWSPALLPIAMWLAIIISGCCLALLALRLWLPANERDADGEPMVRSALQIKRDHPRQWWMLVTGALVMPACGLFLFTVYESIPFAAVMMVWVVCLKRMTRVAGKRAGSSLP